MLQVTMHSYQWLFTVFSCPLKTDCQIPKVTTTESGEPTPPPPNFHKVVESRIIGIFICPVKNVQQIDDDTTREGTCTVYHFCQETSSCVMWKQTLYDFYHVTGTFLQWLKLLKLTTLCHGHIWVYLMKSLPMWLFIRIHKFELEQRIHLMF